MNRWSRRGQESLMLEGVIYLIILVMVLVILLAYAKRIDSQQPFDRAKIASDRALTLSKLLALPFDAEVIMPKGAYNISEEYGDGKVRVMDAQQRSDVSVSYYFDSSFVGVGVANLTPENRLFYTKMIKEGSSVRIGSEKERMDHRLLDCGSVQMPRIPQWVLDAQYAGAPGQFSGNALVDVGPSNPKDVLFNAAEVSLALVNALSMHSNVVLTRRDTIPIALAQRKEFVRQHPFAALMSFGVGSDEDVSHSPVTAYVLWGSKSYAQSRYAACVVLNEFVQEFDGITFVSIVPLNGQWISADDPRGIIDSAEIAIAVDIGNIMVDKEQNMLNENARIAGVISRAMQKIEAGAAAS